MCRPSSLALFVALVLAGSPASMAQHKPEVIERGKKATAFVEVAVADGSVSGSAFCIDRSGLFVTNAHVVAGAVEGKGGVRLVLEIGLKSQRSLRAKVLRADDDLDLALLKVDANDGMTPLELGKDAGLAETAPVVTFGFPFGRNLTVRNEPYPDISVTPSRITALRRKEGRLEGVQFDGQLNPGNSGGAVLDESGRVIGGRCRDGARRGLEPGDPGRAPLRVLGRAGAGLRPAALGLQGPLSARQLDDQGAAREAGGQAARQAVGLGHDRQRHR